jgi:hypothetical protein
MLTNAEVDEIMNSTEIFNSYDVQFVFDYAVVKCCVFALNEEIAIDEAADLLCDDLGLDGKIFARAQDVSVTLLDEDVL